MLEAVVDISSVVLLEGMRMGPSSDTNVNANDIVHCKSPVLKAPMRRMAIKSMGLTDGITSGMNSVES